MLYTYTYHRVGTPKPEYTACSSVRMETIGEAVILILQQYTRGLFTVYQVVGR